MTYVNHFLSQYAGEVGLVSLGVGRDFKRYSISGLYGFVPGGHSGGRAIETMALRQTYRLIEGERLSFHAGLTIFHVLGLEYEVSRYGDPPDSYYPIGSVRSLINLGLSVQVQGETSFYFEGGLNDIWITNWLTNQDVVNPSEHVSLGMGVKHGF